MHPAAAGDLRGELRFAAVEVLLMPQVADPLRSAASRINRSVMR